MDSETGAASGDLRASSEALQLAELARQLSNLQSFVTEGFWWVWRRISPKVI